MKLVFETQEPKSYSILKKYSNCFFLYLLQTIPNVALTVKTF